MTSKTLACHIAWADGGKSWSEYFSEFPKDSHSNNVTPRRRFLRLKGIIPLPDDEATTRQNIKCGQCLGQQGGTPHHRKGSNCHQGDPVSAGLYTARVTNKKKAQLDELRQ